MQQKAINTYLAGAILMLALLPMVASYWLLDEVLNGAISLAVKPEQRVLLESYQEDLKTLRALNPDKEAEYKIKFQQASNELIAYQQPQLLKQLLRDTWMTYYLILFLMVLVLATLAAIWLSRKVAHAYKNLTAQDVAKAKKIQELSYFDQWQTMTKKLAHEINNPLTPIEMMVSNLTRSYHRSAPGVYQQTLQDTQTVVSEEVQKLKRMVRHFSRFSKLPEPELVTTNLVAYCEDFVRQHQHAWERLGLSCQRPEKQKLPEVLLDKLLFNQCLQNLINNALQANSQESHVEVQLQLSVTTSGDAQLRVFNSGTSINSEDCQRIFRMYQSNKQHKENMGLGLPIVKKILLDHGGNIQCVPMTTGAAFDITLPMVRIGHSIPHSNASEMQQQ